MSSCLLLLDIQSYNFVNFNFLLAFIYFIHKYFKQMIIPPPINIFRSVTNLIYLWLEEKSNSKRYFNISGSKKK